MAGTVSRSGFVVTSGRAALELGLLLSARKAKGRDLLRDIALSYPIFEDPVRRPDHNPVIPESFGTCEREPAFPCSSVTTRVVRAFLVYPPAFSFLSAFVSSVAGSRDIPCPLSSPGRFLFRLKRIVPAISRNAIGSKAYIFVKIPVFSVEIRYVDRDCSMAIWSVSL